METMGQLRCLARRGLFFAGVLGDALLVEVGLLTLDVDGRPLKGEFLRSASIVNTVARCSPTMVSPVPAEPAPAAARRQRKGANPT